MKTLSVVVTVLNEKPNISLLIKSVKESLKSIDYELIFVDDGSTDGTQKEIKEHANKHTRLIELRKNYGQSTAMMAGIDFAEGDYIATIDGDLQNDPADIPRMLQKLIDEDWDVVAGNRLKRQDGFLLRKLPSKMANALIRKLTNVHIRDYGCTLKVFKKEIAVDLGLYGEMHRFIPVLAKLQGANITQVDVKHHPRKFGSSKYGLNRSFKVISDLMLIVFFQKYMQKPMHLFGTAGFIIFSIGILLDIYLLIQKIMGHDIWGRPLIILAMIFTLAGIQLVTIGLLAEMNMRTYYESQGKKTYQVRRTFDGSKN
jgi:glycosyltransferase involved in cell wall biosynthesis